jgi:hypothetical protein
MRGIRLVIPPVAVLATAVACEEPTGEPPEPRDSIPPTIVALAPAPAAEGVPVDVVITVRFSEPINPATVGPASFYVRRGFDSVPGTYVFGDSSASFVPNHDLDYVTAFVVTVTRGIRDSAGNQLPNDTLWGFRTRNQTPAPPPGR